jgi:hypothetical protein
LDCFCGCGRKVGIRMRDVNKRGATINRNALLIRALLQRGLSSPAAEAFVSDAMTHCQTLATAVHTNARLDRDLETETSRFMSFANARFSERALRSEVRVSRKSREDAAAEMLAGTWDPFANVEIPGRERVEQAPAPTAHPPTWQNVRDTSSDAT